MEGKGEKGAKGVEGKGGGLLRCFWVGNVRFYNEFVFWFFLSVVAVFAFFLCFGKPPVFSIGFNEVAFLLVASFVVGEWIFWRVDPNIPGKKKDVVGDTVIWKFLSLLAGLIICWGLFGCFLVGCLVAGWLSLAVAWLLSLPESAFWHFFGGVCWLVAIGVCVYAFFWANSFRIKQLYRAREERRRRARDKGKKKRKGKEKRGGGREK